MSNTIIPTAILQEVMDAMDDMATDSRLLDMKQSRVHQFDAARDALRAALEQPDAGPTATTPAGWMLVPVEPKISMKQAALNASRRWAECDAPLPRTQELWASEVCWKAMIEAAPQPPTVKECLTVEQQQVEQEPYLYYDPNNGDTWTQEAINDGCCPPDGLIALYTK